jgi:PAS domain S-box-containing protein
VALSVNRDITDIKEAEEELKNSEEQLKILFEFAPDAYYLNDLKGKFIDGNKEAEKLLGYKKDELINKNFLKLKLLSPNQIPKVKVLLAQNAAGKPTGPDEFTLYRKDGSTVTVEIRSYPVKIKDQILVLGIARDISERKQMENELRLKHEQQEHFLGISRHLTESLDVKEVLTRIAQGAKVILKSIGCTIYLLEEDKKTLTPLIAIEEIDEEKTMLTSLSVDNSFAGQAVKTKRGQAFNDAYFNPKGFIIPGTPEYEDERTMALPLIFDEKIMGTMNLTRIGEPYTDIDLALAETFATYASTALKNAWAYNALHSEVEERKKAEEELRESEERYRLLIENIPTVAWTSNQNGETSFISSNVENVYGYTSDEIYKKGEKIWFGRIHSDDVAKVKKEIDLLFTSNKKYDIEYRIQRKDGKWIWLHDKATVSREIGGKRYAFGVFSDITEKKLVEERIRILSRSVEQSPASIMITDLKGNIEYINPKFTEVTGYSFDEAKGKNPSILKSDETPKEMYKELWETITSGGEWKGEFHNKKKNGDLFWELAYIAPIKNEQRQTTHYLAVKEDITERKLLQQQLTQTQKMESIGTLAGGIAHDFNNLLTVINGFSDLLLMKLKENDLYYKEVSAIRSAGEKATKLTRQILAFSRKQIFQPKIISINDVVSDLDKMIHRLIGEDINIDVNLYPDIPNIKADPGQIEQILINLIVNARDAINQKTEKASEKKIIIETDIIYLNDTFLEKHIGSSSGLHTCFSVKDSGIGMSNETKQKIFDPFFTTKDKGKGTGLGLSTVYGIVKQNNGSIYVYSEPGIGSVFKIYWPASKTKLTTKISEEIIESELQGNEIILLAEDDEEVRNFAFAALKDFGYLVYPVENGKKALNLVKNKNIKVDLLFTDMVMPDMNGKELSERIKEISPNICILFASGYADNYIINSGELDKNINFLQKPYSINMLLKKVREVLDR